MRDTILTEITNDVVTGFSVSDQLPFTQNGTPLYQQNFKKVYVDQPQTEQEPLLDTLDGVSIVNETTTVDAYVTTDAKQLPSNYETMVNAFRNLRLNITGYNQRVTDIRTTFEGDSMVTQATFKFTRTLSNEEI